MSEQNQAQQRLPTSSKFDSETPTAHLYDTTGNRNQSEVCSSEGTRNCPKYNAGSTYGEERPPRLPPRPPRDAMSDETDSQFNGVRKYVIWCVICGTASCLLGCMFGAIHFFLRSYTSSVGYFETIPMFVPAILLIATGLCIIGLAKRQNRCNYLIKISRASSLTSALICALLTFTTATIHMTKLQALQECQYSQKTRTCMCISTHSEGMGKDIVDITGFKLVFDANADCSIVHGALYSCLRAVFGLSVFGVFLEVFICMLVHQLLSHERKKIYWEQLELRCRSLGSGIFQVTSQRPQPHHEMMPRNTFGLCEHCTIQQATVTPTLSLYWRGQTGNFYSPNPGSDEVCRAGENEIQNLQRNRLFNWPWSRSREVQPNLFQTDFTPMRYPQNVAPSDSQYGFASNISERNQQNPYSVIFEPYICGGPPPPYYNSNKLCLFSNACPSSQSTQSNCPTPSQTYFSCDHSNHSNSSFVELNRGGNNQPSNFSSTRENCSVSDIEGDADSQNHNNHQLNLVSRTPRQNISNLITESQVESIRRDCDSPENEYHELNFSERELEKKNRVKTLAFGFDNSAFQSNDQSNWRNARTE